VVTVKNGSGVGVAGWVVNFAVPASGATATLSTYSTVTDANGKVTITAIAGTVAGSYNVTATSNGATGNASFSLTNTAGTSVTSAISTGNNQAIAVNSAFGAPLGVLITDTYGNPVSGVKVSFAAPTNGASATLSASSAVTGSNGIAAITAVANTVSGTYAVTASASCLSTQSFVLTNNNGAASSISVSLGSSQSAQVNTTFTQLLTAKVTDSYGNPVSGTVVTFTPPTSSATATLWGTSVSGSTAKSSTTNSSGVASVTALASSTLGSYSVVATAPGVTGSASFALTNSAISSNVIAQVSVDATQTPTYTVPSNFVGLSLVQSQVQKLIGYQQTYNASLNTTSMNPIYEKLVGNLESIAGGPMMLRMLGDGNGPTTLHLLLPVLNQLYADKGDTYFIGVDFMDDVVSRAVSEVADIQSGVLNSSSIVAIELANEPDGYVSGGAKSSYSYTQFLADEQSYATAILPNTNGLKFSAPVFAGNSTSWSENNFLQLRSSDVSMFNFHYYGGANCTSAPAQNALLLPSSLAPQTGYQNNYPANSYLSTAITTAQNAGITSIRVGEMNSIACHGAFGVSDTFTSALWAMDMGMSYAASGVTGINFFLSSDQTYVKGLTGDVAYNAFDFTYSTSGATRTWKLAYVAPEYYGMMMLDYMLANKAGVIPSTLANNPGRFSSWATKDASGVTHVLLLNKEDGTNSGVSSTGTVQLVLAGHGAATVKRLQSTGIYNGWWDTSTGTLKTDGTVTGRTGITLNGQTFDASSDGSIQGTATTETVTPVNGTYTVNVPVANAVILTIP
jgi:hypothetical protein